MPSIHFVLSAHPYAFERGDAAIARLLMEAAAQVGTVSGSALWSDPPDSSPFPITCVTRPPVRLGRVVLRSALARRSLLHTRFLVPGLVSVLRRRDDDLFVPIHSYMAAAFLAAFPGPERPALAVNYVVSEADVVRQTPGHRRLHALEARRTFADDVAACRLASGTGVFHRPEMEELAAAGVPSLHFLRITLPPAAVTSREAGPNLLFLGDRTWFPNLDGLRRLAVLWPAIRRQVPAARLLVVGAGPVPVEARQDGIEVLGYVDSIEDVWREVRALVAPLAIGGGVRAKILEAAARGVPVLGSAAANGSLAEYLPLGAVGDEEWVGSCVEVLTDAAVVRRRGDELYQANRDWWAAGHFQADVAAWLRWSPGP